MTNENEVAAQRIRMAIDIGGTFTDTVLVDSQDRVLASTKTLTTHDNPADGAWLGAERVIQASGQTLSSVTGFVHGTTLATNALIEKRGAVVASICTEGFRDILDIGYERRYAQYDINLKKPDLLVPRDRCFTIPERMSVDGKPLISLDEAAVATLIDKIDAAGADAVAICLLHAYANPAHEQRLRTLIQTQRPELSISISSEVSPEAREFDRLCTTVANAYIQPLMQSYLARFATRFAKLGLECPILMMTAGGGMCTIETASKFPIRLVESGPAGGAILAARIARQSGLNKVLSFDIGGTTAKLCLIDNYHPQTSRQFEIARQARFIKGSGMPVRIPVIEMIEIGAGGGSIASVDRLGRLTVGPQSAGSTPGPAAFGRGGKCPTVTDSDIVLGYISPDHFAEGYLQIDPALATEALVAEIGSKMDLNTSNAADGVSRIVDESMASAGRMHAVESGKDLGTRTMIAFGGNGPLHATRVARSAGISKIIIPPDPSVGSALGFLYAPISFEIVRSRFTNMTQIDFEAINDLLDDMTAEAQRTVSRGAGAAETTTVRTAFARYSGQGHEIEMTLPSSRLGPADLAPLTAAFESEYRQQFSRPVPGMEIEILNWAVCVTTVGSNITAIAPTPALTTIKPQSKRQIICDLTTKPIQATFVERAQLRPGDHVPGPALIAEPQTTTLVSSDFSAHVDGVGNLVLNNHTEGPKL